MISSAHSEVVPRNWTVFRHLSAGAHTKLVLECDELLGGGGVDAHGCVELALCEPCAHRDAYALDDLGPEIIQGIGIAVRAGLTKSQFDATVGIHPTAAEEFVTLKDKLRVRAC